MSTDSRPKPVLNAATVAAAVVGVIGGLGTILAAFGVVIDVEALSQGATAVIVGAFALVAVAAPVVAALRAQRKVTPLADPRTDGGTPLVPAQAITVQYGGMKPLDPDAPGRHRAP